jgi:Xaa-Pro aminopeptidase
MAQSNEATIKEQRVRAYMRQKRLDAIVLTRQDNFAWMSCGKDNHVVTASDGGVASLVIAPDRKYVVSDNIEAGRIHEEELGNAYESKVYPWHEPEKGAQLMRQLIGAGKAASDDGTAGLPLLEADFAELHYALVPEETERYRALGRDCSNIMTDVAQVVEPGQREMEVAGLISNFSMAHGITPWVLLVAADERIRKFRHPIYTNRKIKDSVMLVLCGRRHGLICSMTRLVSFGKLSRDLIRRHAAVCAVDAAFILSTRVGAENGAIFRTAMEVYAKHGFADEWKLHHQGGPTGYAGRDFKATPAETRKVLANQPYAWNPSITGTKSEDTVLALESGPEFISMPVNWPTVRAEFNGQAIERAAILER